MLRLDEIGENCENLKAKVVSYTTNKTEQSRGGQKDMYVPMDVGHVRSSEPQKEDWENVDEVRRGSMFSNYGMMGHVARDCGRNGMGKGERRRRRQGICPRKREHDERHGERKAQSNLEDPREDVQENRKVEDTKDRAGRAARSDTSYQTVDGESLTSMRKMQTAENAEDNLIFVLCLFVVCIVLEGQKEARASFAGF